MPNISRHTKQKKLLQHELNSFQYFFTAEDLYDRVKKHDIGIATVYRFLKEMAKGNRIHSYKCDKKTVYSLSSSSHFHFTCQKCGETSHIKIDSVQFLRDALKEKICHFQINVEGICRQCQGKND